MTHEAGMALQPGPDLGMLVCAVIVQDQMERNLARKLPVQPAEKPQELLMAVPFMALSNHTSAENLQSGKQRGRAVAFIVMRHRPAPALLERQARLRTIQGLNLAFFVHTQHDCLLRRIQVQAHHVRQFLQEFGIPRQLERWIVAAAVVVFVAGGFCRLLFEKGQTTSPPLKPPALPKTTKDLMRVETGQDAGGIWSSQERDRRHSSTSDSDRATCRAARRHPYLENERSLPAALLEAAERFAVRAPPWMSGGLREKK